MCEQVNEFNIDNFTSGKNYVIDASAGTGKTYTIVEMVKKLLKSDITDITLDKMLIVTYTEKAAGELKDRIRSGLSGMDDEIKSNSENDVDNASICTIHAFCQNIINEYFISAGKPSCQKLIDESEIKQFLKRYIRQGKIYEDIRRYKRWKPEENIEDKLIKKIAAYIGKYYLNAKYEVDNKVVSFENEIKLQFDDIEKNDYVQHCLENGTIQNYEGLCEKIQCISKSKYTCTKDNKQLSELSDILKRSNDLKYEGYQTNKKNMAKIGENDIYTAVDEIKKIKKALENYIDNFYNILTFKYLHDIYTAWQKEKENLCVQTYNDMIRNVREEVVNGGNLLKKLQEKYKYAIIDEFQDTNQKQWDIFKNVFLSEGHNLIVVGDPKQSIYSFQGADVTVYEKAKNEIKNKDGNVFALKKNYRATKDIINSTNAFFDKEKNPKALPKEMSFVPSNPGNEKFKAIYNGGQVKAFWITEDNVTAEEYAKIVCNRIVDFCTKDGNKTRLQIWDKDGNQKNVSFKDFAVLARTRSEMKPIQDAFEKCGIPYTQYKDTKLFSGKECADWVAVLNAVNAPDFTGYNRQFFKKAMLTAFFGYSLNEIQSEKFDRDSINEIDFFDNWRQLAENKEWAKLIEKIIVDTNVAQKLNSLGEVKTFGVLMQIGDYCADYLTKNDDLEMLIRNLQKQSSNDNDEDDDENSATVAKATAMDCVQVMTIHASKGLEFPVVISVSGFKGQNNSAVKAYTYHKDSNTYLTFSKNDICKNESTDEFKRLYYVAYTRAKYLLMLPQYAYPKSGRYEDNQLKFISNSIKEYKEKSKSESSNDNCLYAYMPMPLDADKKSLEELSKSVKKIYRENLKESESFSQEKADKRLEALEKFNPYFHTPHKHAYSSLSHGGERHSDENAENTDLEKPVTDTDTIENDKLKHNNGEETENAGLSGYDTSAKVIDCAYDSAIEPIELSPNFIAGTGIGNVLHRVFELTDYTAKNTDIENLIKDCFAEEKIRCKDEWIDDIKNMVQNVLGADLPGIKGNDKDGTVFSLKDISADSRKNEVEFNFNIFEDKPFSHYMNGFVDLIFERDGYYSVLDWKSDRLNADFTCYNDKDSLKKHVDELYSIQRVLYSYCLVKWLKQFYGVTEQEVFERHFGGIYYVFLRGCNESTGNGIYAQTWESFEQLEKEYRHIIEKRVY